jgi:amino acid transporter
MGRESRTGALTVKLAATGVGVALTAFSLLYLMKEVGFLLSNALSYVDVLSLVAAIAGLLSGITLIVLLPESTRGRFWRPRGKVQPHPVYGFGTSLAIGIGATLGSPLFILIPLNVMQYAFVSIGSLVLAGIITFLVSKVYADLYVISSRTEQSAVGGPSFTRIACGVRSVRYFIARVSMWLANTALAAYSAIIFVLFVLNVLPGILTSVGMSAESVSIYTYAVVGLFVLWFILNTLLERRVLRLIGWLQIVLTVAMIFILLYQSYILGAVGSWNLTGLLKNGLSGDWPLALLTNTAFLYLLFFGFQEVQALDRDCVESSGVPILSWLRPGYRVPKTSYFRSAMIGSVLVALVVNILFALAVYSSRPDATAMASSQIPALYIASTFLGSNQALIMAVAFLIATFTTFVPSFMAASRHLGSLGEDGFMPRSVSNLAWVFTLVSVGLLVIAGQDFLVNITDYMTLISLGFIALSAIWIRKRTIFPVSGADLLPLFTGALCFVVAAVVYLLSPSVAILGTVTLFLVYLIYDSLELGALGVQMFLLVFDVVTIFSLASVPRLQRSVDFVLPFFRVSWRTADDLLLYGLGLASLFLLLNLLVDVSLLRRTHVSFGQTDAQV